MDPVQGCRRTVDDARAMIGTVQPDELATPTPCKGWDARALIGHMVGVCQMFTTFLRGGTFDPATMRGNPDLAGDDPAAAYTKASSEVMREWEAPGALDKTLPLPLGPTPAALAIQLFATDQLVHTWDLAKALGRPYAMNEDLAAQAHQLLDSLLKPDMRGPDKAFDVAQPCPADAPIQERMIALSGRRL